MPNENEKTTQPPMNTSVPFYQPQGRPDLSLKRRGPSYSRSPMSSEDMPPADGSLSGPYGHAGLQAAWDKLYRARAILEAEQAHLRDDRIALQGELESLGMREHLVAARELRIQQYEQGLVVERLEADAAAAESTFSKLTKAPFDFARSVFGRKD
jgi:hypothetical protein